MLPLKLFEILHLFYFWIFENRVFHCIFSVYLGCPRTRQTGLELEKICLGLPLECRDYRYSDYHTQLILVCGWSVCPWACVSHSICMEVREVCSNCFSTMQIPEIQLGSFSLAPAAFIWWAILMSCMYAPHFVYSFTDNIWSLLWTILCDWDVQIFQDLIFSWLGWFGLIWYMPRSGIARFYENSVFILEELSYCFHRNCAMLRCHRRRCCWLGFGLFISRFLFCDKVRCFVSSFQLFLGSWL